MKRLFAFFLLAIMVAVGGCSSTSSTETGSLFKRVGKENTDPRWPSFEAINKSFEDIKLQIETGKEVTLEDLDYRGFGPSTNNASEVGYLELEKLLIGEKGDRERLPKKIKECTEKKEQCYGIVVSVSSLDTEGKELFFKRMLSGEKKTVARGWKFGAVFAIERERPDEKGEKVSDRVVAAYAREKNGNVFTRKEEDDAPGAAMKLFPSPSLFGLGF